MASNYGFVQVAPSNAYVFTNASNNDVVMYGTNSSNQVLIGAQSNAYANIALTSSNIAFNVTKRESCLGVTDCDQCAFSVTSATACL